MDNRQVFSNILTLLLVLSGFFILPRAYAVDDLATIQQSGNENAAYVNQITTDSRFSEYEGASAVDITQIGDMNYAEIHDLGKNHVDIEQQGIQQEFTALVEGSGNELLVKQEGGGNSGDMAVVGDNNAISLSQSGNADHSDIQVEGINNSVTVVQSGNSLGFSLELNGNNRYVTVTQQGIWCRMLIWCRDLGG